jgi:hypothetical protein
MSVYEREIGLRAIEMMMAGYGTMFGAEKPRVICFGRNYEPSASAIGDTIAWCTYRIKVLNW